MRGFTLVIADNAGDCQEALYADGRLIATPDGGGAFSASGLLDAIAMNTISVQANYIEVDQKYDEEVIAESGWPQSLDEIPESARVS